MTKARRDTKMVGGLVKKVLKRGYAPLKLPMMGEI
tara:strand:+ start:289 stop:393 length:105 start_codon:yes stop_codon:yes gene_type:complete